MKRRILVFAMVLLLAGSAVPATASQIPAPTPSPEEAILQTESNVDAGVPHIIVYVMLDGIWREEFIELGQETAEAIQQEFKPLKFDGKRGKSYHPAYIYISPFGGSESACNEGYQVFVNAKGQFGMQRVGVKGFVSMPPNLLKRLMDQVRTKTSWALVPHSEVRDIVKAKMTIGERVQEIDDLKRLRKLEALLKGAQPNDVGGCPYGGVLEITREDGEVYQIQIATDSCDSMILGTSQGYKYGTRNSGQSALFTIFDEVGWNEGGWAGGV